MCGSRRLIAGKFKFLYILLQNTKNQKYVHSNVYFHLAWKPVWLKIANLFHTSVHYCAHHARTAYDTVPWHDSTWRQCTTLCYCHRNLISIYLSSCCQWLSVKLFKMPVFFIFQKKNRATNIPDLVSFRTFAQRHLFQRRYWIFPWWKVIWIAESEI